ncbi:hypothetical protein EDB80DRAFT_590106, partial [Ilyonectria destructans]
KYGKALIICWPTFMLYFGLRFASDAYYIINQYNTQKENTVTLMTNAGSIIYLLLTLIDIVYKIILSVTHLTNIIGINIAVYIGKTDPNKSEGVKNTILNKIRNLLIFGVIVVGILFYLWPTEKYIFSTQRDINYKAAKALIMAAGPAIVLYLIRLSYSVIYTFNCTPSLNLVTRSFTTGLILIFGMQLYIVLIVLIGG